MSKFEITDSFDQDFIVRNELRTKGTNITDESYKEYLRNKEHSQRMRQPDPKK